MEITIATKGVKLGTVIYDEKFFDSQYDPFKSVQPILNIRTPEFIVKQSNDILKDICNNYKSLIPKVPKVIIPSSKRIK